MKIKKVNCLIDFFSEEIPASMQIFLEQEFKLLFKEVLNKLPMEFAVEAQKLLEISLEGSVG